MMNRDLMQRQMFRNGGGVVPMQDGGEPTFRERIEALSKAAGRSIKGLMEPNRDPYENMNPIQDPSAPMNLSPEEQAARRAQYEIQQGRFTQAEIEQILRNNPEYGDYGSMEGAPRYNFPTPSGPRRTEDNDPGFIQRILDYARDGYTLSNDTPIRQPVQEPVPEQNYRNGGPVYYMQEGGMAPMGMPPQGMPPPGAMMPEMAQAQQAGMDPAILEQMLAQASQGIGSLDEAEDYEQVMNMMTGTSATIAERRMELADLVGDEDAQQTPDSVLTLVQPVIMMAKTDEGIGGLAQDQMTEAVTGDMAGGIMSTIDMGAQEGPAPVNFRYGGAVQYMEPGGVAMNEQQQKDFDLLQQEYELNKNFYGQLIDKDAQTRALQGQQDLTQAQMLFDLANTGLAIAAPGPRTMSVAEKLAYAAQQTELFPRIGARAAELGKFKQAQDQESRQYDLAAAQGAMGMRDFREKARIEAKNAKTEVKATSPFVTTKPVEIDGNMFPENTVVNLRPDQLALHSAETFIPYVKPSGENANRKSWEVTSPIVYKGVPLDVGQVLVITEEDANDIEGFATSVKAYSGTPKESGTTDVRTRSAINIDGTNVPAGVALKLSNSMVAEIIKTQPDAFEPVNETDRNKAADIFGADGVGKALNYFVTAKVPGSNMSALEAYGNGAEDRTLEAQIAAFTKVTTDATGKAQKNALPPFVIDQIKRRVFAGGQSPVPLNTLGLTREEMQQLAPSQDVPLLNADNTVNVERALADGTFIIDIGADLTQAAGFTSTVDRFFNVVMGQLGKAGIGPGYAGKEALLTTAADAQLRELSRTTIATFRPDTRIFKLDLDGLKGLVSGFEPGGFKNDQGALAALKKTRDSLAMSYSVARDEIQLHEENAGYITPQEYGTARRAEKDLRMLIAEYTAAIVAFESNMGGRGSAVTSTGGSAATSTGGWATGNLPRVNAQKKSNEIAPVAPVRTLVPRERVPTQVNTVRPEAVLSVEQPPVPETILAGIEPFVPEAPSANEYTSDQLSPDVLAYIENSIINQTWGDLAAARPDLYRNMVGDPNEEIIDARGQPQGKKHAPTEIVRTTEQDIRLGLSRALNGFDMMTLEERKVLIENIEQELKNREQN